SLQPHTGIDVLLEDRLRRLGGDFFNVHSTCGRGHKYRLAFGTVHKDAQVEFLLDGQSFFDEEAADDTPFRSRLVGDEFHTEHFGGEFAGFLRRLGDLDPAAFAASAGMDLGFYNDSGRARIKQVFGGALGLFARLDHVAPRDGYAKLAENRFSLIL